MFYDNLVTHIRSVIDPNIVLFMFILSFISVIICGHLNGRESVQVNDHKPAHQVAGLHQSMNKQTITNLHIRWRGYTSQRTNKFVIVCLFIDWCNPAT
jgi:hypothetical protein